jgi:signal transduction histidine kinase
VSHDLRAPLRAIDGFSQALLDDCGEQLDAAARMAELIDDLLDLSRVTRREMQNEPVDLSALTTAIGAQLQRSEPGRHVELSVSSGLRARGDPHLLRLVLENLLGNAWKFTSRTAGASIHFYTEERDGRTWYCVRDNGAGFDMSHAERLFKPFTRLHRQDEFPGHGLGLATVQRIVKRHGGDIAAEATPNQGATVRFSLGARPSDR